jgi:hypothetical protein
MAVARSRQQGRAAWRDQAHAKPGGWGGGGRGANAKQLRSAGWPAVRNLGLWMGGSGGVISLASTSAAAALRSSTRWQACRWRAPSWQTRSQSSVKACYTTCTSACRTAVWRQSAATDLAGTSHSERSRSPFHSACLSGSLRNAGIWLLLAQAPLDRCRWAAGSGRGDQLLALNQCSEPGCRGRWCVLGCWGPESLVCVQRAAVTALSFLADELAQHQAALVPFQPAAARARLFCSRAGGSDSCTAHADSQPCYFFCCHLIRWCSGCEVAWGWGLCGVGSAGAWWKTLACCMLHDHDVTRVCGVGWG